MKNKKLLLFGAVGLGAFWLFKQTNKRQFIENYINSNIAKFQNRSDVIAKYYNFIQNASQKEINAVYSFIKDIHIPEKQSMPVQPRMFLEQLHTKYGILKDYAQGISPPLFEIDLILASA